MTIDWVPAFSTVSRMVKTYWSSTDTTRVKRSPWPLSQVRVTGVAGVSVEPEVRRQGVFGPGTPPGTLGPVQPNWAK